MSHEEIAKFNCFLKRFIAFLEFTDSRITVLFDNKKEPSCHSILSGWGNNEIELIVLFCARIGEKIIRKITQLN